MGSQPAPFGNWISDSNIDVNKLLQKPPHTRLHSEKSHNITKSHKLIFLDNIQLTNLINDVLEIY